MHAQEDLSNALVEITTGSKACDTINYARVYLQPRKFNRLHYGQRMFHAQSAGDSVAGELQCPPYHSGPCVKLT